MNKNLVEVIGKVIANPKLAEAFFNLKSLEEAYTLTWKDLKYLVDETAKSMIPEELTYVVDEIIDTMHSDTKFEEDMLLAVAERS